MTNPNTPVKLLKMREVLALVGMSRASVYRKLDEGTFPRPVKLGQRAIAWREDTISDWIEGLQTSEGRAA